jgi:hypothetical protein
MNVRAFLIGLFSVALVFNMTGTAYAAQAVRINVKGELEKDRDTSKTESDKSSSKTKTETQSYELEVTVANTVKQDGTFDVEWYFFKRSYEDGRLGDPVLCEKDKKTVSIAGMKRITLPVTSKPLSWQESKNNKSSKNSNNNNDDKSSGKSITGDEYGGYVILVKYEGEVLAEYSDEKKFLTDEWLGKLNGPVESGRAASAPSKSSKKKGKK